MRNKEVEVLKEFNRRTGFNSVPVTPEKVELFRFVMNITNRKNLACTTDETKLSLSPSVKQHRRPICIPDLSSRHDWPVKKDIVDLPIRIRGNPKRTSGNSLSPLGAQNRDTYAASQTILTKITSGA